MKVYLLWLVSDDDLYPVDSEVVGVYATRERAEIAAAGKEACYMQRYHVEEREVIE